MAKYAAAEACVQRRRPGRADPRRQRPHPASTGSASLLTAARVGRIAPVSREMILNFVAHHTLGLPEVVLMDRQSHEPDVARSDDRPTYAVDRRHRHAHPGLAGQPQRAVRAPRRRADRAPSRRRPPTRASAPSCLTHTGPRSARAPTSRAAEGGPAEGTADSSACCAQIAGAAQAGGRPGRRATSARAASGCSAPATSPSPARGDVRVHRGPPRPRPGDHLAAAAPPARPARRRPLLPDRRALRRRRRRARPGS